METCCLLCEKYYSEPDQRFTIDSAYSGATYGVCPACRRHAEIGKRVEGMEERECRVNAALEAICEADGYNYCLAKAKGAKP